MTTKRKSTSTASKPPRKLSVKKETVHDLDAGKGGTGELSDDQLDLVAGGGVTGRCVQLPPEPKTALCNLTARCRRS